MASSSARLSIERFTTPAPPVIYSEHLWYWRDVEARTIISWRENEILPAACSRARTHKRRRRYRNIHFSDRRSHRTARIDSDRLSVDTARRHANCIRVCRHFTTTADGLAAKREEERRIVKYTFFIRSPPSRRVGTPFRVFRGGTVADDV